MNIDVVIIGVNAAETLADCISSVKDSRYTRGQLNIFYVDGGSCDRSVEIAHAFRDVTALELVMDHPTPGSGRNAGWKAGQAPLVQFLDSDTILHPGWLDHAVDAMTDGVSAVFGNRNELHPERSVYNWIAELEWNGPAGEADAFGGDVLVQRSALEATGGYDEILVGGEDPELSQRIRKKGGKLVHLNQPMTRHDMAMYSLRGYLKRAFRTGYGYAAVSLRHGFKGNGFWNYELGRIAIRGGFAPALLTLSLALGFIHPLFTLLALPALGLIFYPRVFSVSNFMNDKQINRSQAKTYAIHCALVVIPEFWGVVRLFLGKATGRPLQNHLKRKPLQPGRLATTLSAIFSLFLVGCISVDQNISDVSFEEAQKKMEEYGFPVGEFQTEPEKAQTTYASEDDIEHFSNSVPEDYLVGPGDLMSITVRGRPDASIENVLIAPDGRFSVPRLGILNAKEKTTVQLTDEITLGMREFYSDPEITLTMHEFNNNKAFVLGRVNNPGVVKFAGQGTLLEALSMSGGLPTVAEEAFLTRAMIFRGKDMVIWVDLRELLNNGNMAMNPRLRNNDVVYIPESDDQLVYVMGEVKNPGALRLKSNFSVLDAVMFSGGPTVDARYDEVYLIRYRDGKGMVTNVNVDQFLEKGDITTDYLLEDGDIIYVGRKNFATFNYYLAKVSPAVWYLDFARASLSGSGLFGGE